MTASEANFLMVNAGFARWYRDYAKTGPAAKELKEAQAKAAKRGLRSEPNPVPLWELRRTEAFGERIVSTSNTAEKR